ncbi:glutathione S-transferase family protein [Bradyrhizobium sp. B120]|uniref:glutathione S-transferase family protein n=1 Tax=Bradyrhizobium sp. B120 TaxID=3410088 RepID=UPI003B97E110
MLDYYTVRSLGGNGRKVSIMLAETGLEHVVHFVDIEKGEQKEDWFTAINPNGRIPAIVDHDLPGGLRLGESGAILVHLAEKTGRFLPAEPKARAQTLMWTFWQVGGVGPMFGQWSYFARTAAERVPFAIQRYRDECERLFDTFDRNLAAQEYAADEYSIADMALLPWMKPGYAGLMRAMPDARDRWPNLRRWIAAVEARPAVALAMSCAEGAAARIGHGASSAERV